MYGNVTGLSARADLLTNGLERLSQIAKKTFDKLSDELAAIRTAEVFLEKTFGWLLFQWDRKLCEAFGKGS